MKRSFESQQRYLRLSESYFWVATQHEIVIKFVESLIKTYKRAAPLKILDAGCGNGNLIAHLSQFGQVTGIDASKEAVDFCQKEHSAYVQQALIQKTPFSDNAFDFILCVDTIEHIEDDFGAMRELYRILKTGGFLIITVPAFMCLWGPHDEKQGHFRRYIKPDFCNLAQQAGFKIRKCSCFKSIFFLPLLFIRLFKKIINRQSDDFYNPSFIVNQLLRLLLSLEIRILSFIDIPIGTSLIAVLYK